jgi:LacI family transcriptional regulator
MKKKKGKRSTAPALNALPHPPPKQPSYAAGLFSKRVTIYDLARVADVSPATISRVLNNRGSVKADTRERVLRAATELRVKPQSSVRDREMVILSDPSFPDRIGGYAATLTAHLTLAFSHRNIGVLMPRDPLNALTTRFYDGIVVVGADKALRGLVEEIETRIPVVHIDGFPIDKTKFGVHSDHYGAGYKAARHFLERGRRKPGFIAGDFPASIERLRGFRKALSEANLAFDEQLACLFGPESNHASVLARLVRAGADAIYAPGSSFEALECVHNLGYIMGLKIPQDISLIGGENDRVSFLLTPPLTTIEEPLRDMAEKAVDMLDKLSLGETLAERNVMFPVRLIQRNSVA